MPAAGDWGELVRLTLDSAQSGRIGSGAEMTRDLLGEKAWDRIRPTLWLLAQARAAFETASVSRIVRQWKGIDSIC